MIGTLVHAEVKQEQSIFYG